jgi:hypothetical protein
MAKDVELFSSDELDMSAFLTVESNEPDEEQDDNAGFIPAKNKEVSTDVEDVSNVAEEEIPESVGNEDEDEDTGFQPASQPTLYSSLAKVLAEEGVLTSFDISKSKVETVEDLIGVIKDTIKENEYSDLTDDQKVFLEGIRTGVPADQLYKQQSQVKQLESITSEEIEDNEELRKQLIYSDFLNKGVSPEKASKLTQRSIDIGEDVSDAVEALEELKKVQKDQLFAKIQAEKDAENARTEKNKQELLKFKENVFNTKEIIPGLKINTKVAEKVFDQAVRPVHQLNNGQVVNAVVKAKMDDPIGFETKLNYLFYITKGFSDFSKIATTQKSKAVQELDDLVKGNTFAPRASAMGGNLDYLPPELQGAFDPSMIENIK